MAWLIPAGVGYVGGSVRRALLATAWRVVVLDGVSTNDLARLGDLDRGALTSDGSLDPVSTPRWLDRLAAHAVRSAFFLLGAMAGGWRSALAALPRSLHHCARRALRVGQLSEHGGEGGG